MWVYIIYSLIVCMGKNCPLVHPICPLVDTFTGFRFYNILVVNLLLFGTSVAFVTLYTKRNVVMIRMDNVRKVYRTEEVETVALDKMSLHIKEQEFVAIMGPSGCGKSTLLNILGLLDDPTSGSYFFHGVEVGNLPEKKRCHLRGDQIGFVFQSYQLIEELTVFENVELPLLYSGV